MDWVEEVHDPFYLKEDVKVESDGRMEQVTPLTLTKTMRSFNETLIKAQEENNEINLSILSIIIDIYYV